MKSKKNLARKILCGLLTAGVVGVAGSAMAANAIGTVTVDGVVKSINPNGSFNIGEVDSGVVSISNIGTALYITSANDIANINGKSVDVKSENGAGAIIGTGTQLFFGSENTEKINIDAGDDGIRIIRGYADIKAKEINFNIRADGCAAIWLQNNTEDDIAPVDAASAKLTADKITINATDRGLVAYSNGQMAVNGDLTIDAPIALDVRGVSTVNINADGNHKTVLNGDIVFETPNSPGDAQNSGKKINANVYVNLKGEGSSWTGRSYQEYKINGQYEQIVEIENEPYHGIVKGFKMDISDGASWNMTDDSFINNVTVGKNSAINVKANTELANLQNAKLDGGTIKLEGEYQQVNVVEELSGAGTVATKSLDNNVKVTSLAQDASITVNGTSEVTDKIASGSASLQDLANVVKGANAEDNKSLASKVTSDANDIVGGYAADVDNKGNVVTQSIQTPENPTNRAISDMASISLMTWRQENNDMNKRLGELRDSNGEHGAWARMARGESKYGAQNVKNQYNYYQVGYDEKLSVNPNWTVGVALTRTEGNSTFATGSGENKHTGFAVYGSYLNDNGSFIDLIAKYARMDNEYKTVGAGVCNADYETNGYSLSAEYGKRFTKDNGFWIEPQVELTYGTVGSASYTTSKGATVYQEGVDSLVGRLGFSLGKNIKQGNVYVRASYLYDFDGETKAMMSKAGAGSFSFEQDLGGGWWEVGVGTNLNLSEATHLYFDVEKTYGGNVATPWQWNAGVRWSF